LNYSWQKLTDDLLPLWLAPNAVTALGGGFSLCSYLVTAMYSFNFTEPVPNWILLVNGLCLILYYTLDCMDGKQARRTQSSSPLGQLFDHGVDCVSNLSHVSLMQCILVLNARQYLLLQTSLQFGFFIAQWEEYYTGRLPHAAGNLGTTEVLYGMAIWSLLTGVGLMSRAAYDQQVPRMMQDYLPNLPGSRLILGDDDDDEPIFQVRHGIVLFWVYGFVVLSVLSLTRVTQHLRYSNSPPKVCLSAVSKLASPVLLCALVFVVTSSTKPSSTDASTTTGVRYPSLAIGLVFCIITIKLIVFGMAKMAYSSLQLDVLPLLVMAVLKNQEVLPVEYAAPLLYPLATAAYLCRLGWWTHAAVDQLCQRLHIQLFRITPTTKSATPNKAS
jgi:ethanolaminephosphotransferase